MSEPKQDKWTGQKGEKDFGAKPMNREASSAGGKKGEDETASKT